MEKFSDKLGHFAASGTKAAKRTKKNSGTRLINIIKLILLAQKKEKNP